MLHSNNLGIQPELANIMQENSDTFPGIKLKEEETKSSHIIHF